LTPVGFFEGSYIGYVVNGLIGDLKSALALEAEMIHPKTKKLEIYTASGDLPFTNTIFLVPLPPLPDNREMHNAIDMIVGCFHQSTVSWQFMTTNQIGTRN
jgi:hypothetical protein